MSNLLARQDIETLLDRLDGRGSDDEWLEVPWLHTFGLLSA